MRITKQINYYPEDLVPYSVVRSHLRYGFGDQEALIKSYVHSACDYMSTLTNRVFASTTPNLHEDTSGDLTVSDTALSSTVTIYLNRDEAQSKVHQLFGIYGDFTLGQLDYRDTNGDWITHTSPDAKVRLLGYPIELDFREMDEFADEREDGQDVYRIQLTGGDNVASLPAQFKQALLMLVAHYDTQREAEYTGGLTSEIKEGVQRLISSVKVY